MTTFRGESPTDRYYIQDTRSYVGNDCLWWCPNGNGYTTNLSDAGIYDRQHAKSYRETDHAWPVEEIEPLTYRTVDMQKLRRSAGGDCG
jgi:hypothetical protein